MCSSAVLSSSTERLGHVYHLEKSIYRAAVVARAQRPLRCLPPRLQQHILDRITEPGWVSYPPGTAKLSGEDDLYRI